MHVQDKIINVIILQNEQHFLLVSHSVTLKIKHMNTF